MPSPEASRRNIRIARAANRRTFRSWQESKIIQLYIWQAYQDGGTPKQQVLADRLGVDQSWVSRVSRRMSQGMNELCSNPRVTLEDLRNAERFRIASSLLNQNI